MGCQNPDRRSFPSEEAARRQAREWEHTYCGAIIEPMLDEGCGRWHLFSVRGLSVVG